MEWAWNAMFIGGAALVCFSWLSPLLKDPVPANTVRTLIERYWRRGKGDEPFVIPARTAGERAFLEKARLAGVSWSYQSYRAGRWLIVAAGIYLYAAFMFSGRAGSGLVQFAVCGMLIGIICWLIPEGILAALSSRRRGLVLAEISKFAHRMSICITDQNDVRELVLRAGRPMKVLKPYIQQLAAQWGNDQREAILAFKDGVGISEVYPLVNAFASLSRARPPDVKRLLAEHSRSIDASLEADIAKRIENAPVWISFYIMIPFLVCLLLFVYPWMATVLEQLAVSFTAEP